MPPLRTSLDPDGYYSRLGVEPSATPEAIVSAFRARVRVLHPDVPRTGNAAAFVAVKEAYDVVSNAMRREAYDRKARALAQNAIEPEVIEVPAASYQSAHYQASNYRATSASSRQPANAPLSQPRLSDMPIIVWAALAAFLCLCVYQAVSHLMAPATVVSAGIRPNAATVEPLSDSAHEAVLYGPTPMILPGKTNFYVLPTGTPAILWHLDTTGHALVPLRQLPPFSAVQAIRLIRQNGLLEVLVDDHGNGFVSADHLTPGDAVAARAAYCGYNSGPTPYDGELLEHHGNGDATLTLENRAVQPAVIKLRDAQGTVAAAVFLGPGGHVDLGKLPEGLYRPDFAVGELWSRACNMFAAGMRARRMEMEVRLPGIATITVAPDSEEPKASDISDHAFAQD